MKINRQDFIGALERVKPGLANSMLVEQADHLIFSKDVIRTYNDEVAITFKFKTELEGAVPAKEFYSLFTKIPDDTMTATLKDGKFIFKGKGRKASFNINPEIRIPAIDTPGPRSKLWMNLPEDFSSSIKVCAFSVSKNIAEIEFTCIALTGSSALSCDRVRATKMPLGCEIKKDFLLPGTTASILSDYNPHRYYLDTNWIHFINKENITFSCRQVDKEYPVDSINGVFNVKGKKIKLPDELSHILERSKILVSGENDDKEVSILFTKGKLICEAIGIVGSYIEEIETDYKGKDFKISVHPELLIEILKRFSNAVIGTDKVLFKDDSGFEHVIMLAAPAEELKPVKESKTTKRKRG